MYNVRLYEADDFAMLKSWWKETVMIELRKEAVPCTTFILEKDGQAIMSIALFLMNCADGAMVENLIGNPEYKGKREGAAKELFAFAEKTAKGFGYSTLVLFSHDEKLKRLYESFGYQQTLSNVTTYCKQLK